MRNKILIGFGLAAGLALVVSLAAAQTVTPTPSPTDTTTPTPTPTAAVTPTPTPSPSPVATPTPTPSPVATPTPTPSPVATPSPTPIPTVMPHVQPEVLQVGPEGRVLMRGTIDAVSSNSITVKSWGGDWVVNVSANTEVLPAAAGNDPTKFQVGDFVGVNGTVSTGASWTIDARIVRDWTYRQAINQERKQNIQSVRETVKSETPRNYQGTASAVTATGFTLTVNGTVYTVDIAANAKLVNKTWLTITTADIQNGDTVRVWGANSNGTITAEVVRDLSIPRHR